MAEQPARVQNQKKDRPTGKCYTVGEAAKALQTTAETLRHYDRIGLVKPSTRKEWNRYRYYTEQDLVRLSTVQALQIMDMSLQEIRDILDCCDLRQVILALDEAAERADAKIAALERSKEKIARARASYVAKAGQSDKPDGFYVEYFPERAILLSDSLETPSLDVLSGYLRHFEHQVGEARRGEFDFEDAAGIYYRNSVKRMYALCRRYAAIDGLTILPAGRYLCATCPEEKQQQVLEEVQTAARKICGTTSEFALQIVVVVGILRWDYEIQVLLDTGEEV